MRRVQHVSPMFYFVSSHSKTQDDSESRAATQSDPFITTRKNERWQRGSLENSQFLNPASSAPGPATTPSRTRRSKDSRAAPRTRPYVKPQCRTVCLANSTPHTSL